MKTKSVPERALYLEFEDDDGRVYPVTVRLKQGDPAAAVCGPPSDAGLEIGVDEAGESPSQ